MTKAAVAKNFPMYPWSDGSKRSYNGYATNFPLTENPISEAGLWIPGGISSPRTNPQTVGTHAYGTMSSFDGTNFIDSIAVLNAPFSANQSVQGTVWNTGAVDGLEIELVLRGNISALSNTGYEVDIVHTGPSVGLVSWNGPPNAFTILTTSNVNVSISDGDVWFAQMVGTVVTVKCNGNLVLTYDTAGDAFKIASGTPGIGFWNQTGSATNSPNFGWKHFQASNL